SCRRQSEMPAHPSQPSASSTLPPPSSSAKADDPVLTGGRWTRGAQSRAPWLLDRPLSRAMTCFRGAAWFCAALLMVSPAMADKLDDIKARGKLVIGVAEASPPFSFRDGDRGVVGYDVDLAAEVAKRLGVGLAKVSIINAERIPSLRDDKVDLVAMG